MLMPVKEFLLREGLDKTDIDVIGFHGQTITHDPAREFYMADWRWRVTW